MSYLNQYNVNIEPIMIQGEQAALMVNYKLEQERLARSAELLALYGIEFNRPSTDSVVTVDQINDRCFDAAFALASATGLSYAEGVVRFRGVKPSSRYAIVHAWCCTDYGEVIDPTMGKHYGKPYCSYFGIPIKLEFVAERAKRNGFIGCIDGRPDDPRSGIYRLPPTEWLNDNVRVQHARHA